jgi:hypothetical protein
MADENPVRGFYKHSDSKSSIGWETCMDSTVIGPTLQQTFDVLREHGLKERARMYQQEGGWSDDMYVVHRRLFKRQEEIARFMGDSGSGDPRVANVYEVVINSTSGWAQYLSVVLKGPFDEEIAKALFDLDFAPKYSYLAKQDPVPRTSGRPSRLWLDDIVEFPSLPPRG